MKRKVKIWFAAFDQGGKEALIPVIEKLKKDKKFVVKTFFKDLPGKLQEKPDLIFTATGIGKTVDKKMLELAAKEGIKSVSLVDFWSNYKLRFGKVLPDYILVIDPIMKKEMAEADFPRKKLVVVGNPAFDKFRVFGKKGEYVSFFSQPFSELKINPGYDEIEVLKDIVESLEKLGFEGKLKIKLHPRAKCKRKFDGIMKKTSLDCSLTDSKNLLENSKAVFGMNTAVLFRAALGGKPVLSYQPELKGNDPLISNRLGLSLPVYEKKDLIKAMEKILSGRSARKNKSIFNKYARGNSTLKTVKFIKKIT